MSLLMRDSITAADIPLDNLAAVGGYGDGPYQWSSADWTRFPPPIVSLAIVINPAHQGDILDVERFDASPSDCPGWGDRFNRPARRRPTIYSSRDLIAAVRFYMDGRPFDWWAATLDGTTDRTEGAVAVQWKGSALTGGHYDESVILDEGWLGGGIMTDQEVTALFTDWYVVYAGRYPTADDFAYIAGHWLPAWRTDPVKARFDFGQAASGEVGGKDVRPVRHFELPASVPTIHDHGLCGPRAGRTAPNDPPTV